MTNYPTDDQEQRNLYIWLDERLQQLTMDQMKAHERLRTDMTTGFAGVNIRLDGLGSKVNAHEVELGILKDRSNRAESQGGIFGAITGGLAAGVVLLVKSLFKN